MTHLCWHEPVYKDFMIAVWQEFCRKFPDITGILITPGEFSNCVCDYCRNKRPEVMADFIQTFVDVLKANHKKPLVRAWWCTEYGNRLPKDVTYVVKYTVFDCIGGASPDPLVKEWLEAGHRIWFEKEVTGSISIMR